MTTRSTCRACEGSRLETLLDFGQVPLAEVLLEEKDLPQEDAKYPLELALCLDCALVQVTEDIPLDILYNDTYSYYTSVNPTLVKHFQDGALAIRERKPLGKGSLVIEAASNDGAQLAAFQKCGADVLGIDPASGPVEAANKLGITSRCLFFDAATAADLKAEGLQADLITGNNVLCLIQDPSDFARAVESLLKPDGMLVIESAYLVDMISMTAFDMVFHQNATYWTATSLQTLFASTGLRLVDVEHIPILGGSLRMYLSREGTPSQAATDILAKEKADGVGTPTYFAPFIERVHQLREDLLARLAELRASGKRIAAYGASGGMATTLLAFLDLPADTLEYAVDLSHHKHGRWTAGYRLLIRPVETLAEDQPDYALLLAWNFEAPILAAQSEWRAGGGKFLIPIPELREV